MNYNFTTNIPQKAIFNVLDLPRLLLIVVATPTIMAMLVPCSKHVGYVTIFHNAAMSVKLYGIIVILM